MNMTTAKHIIYAASESQPNSALHERMVIKTSYCIIRNLYAYILRYSEIYIIGGKVSQDIVLQGFPINIITGS